MSGSGSGRSPVIAIDGPAGSGKSTLARRLAHELGLPYVNTGAMYRAVTRRALDAGVDPDDGPSLARLGSEIAFDLDRNAEPPELTVDGAVPGPALVAPEVDRLVSAVSRHPEVRELLRSEQRRLVASGGAVMEGRDIGTVVCQDAEAKIFLDAKHEERAARRAEERPRDEEIGQDLAQRDSLDSRVTPLTPAPDAVRIDTSRLSPEEVLRKVLQIVRHRLGPSR